MTLLLFGAYFFAACLYLFLAYLTAVFYSLAAPEEWQPFLPFAALLWPLTFLAAVVQIIYSIYNDPLSQRKRGHR